MSDMSCRFEKNKPNNYLFDKNYYTFVSEN